LHYPILLVYLLHSDRDEVWYKLGSTLSENSEKASIAVTQLRRCWRQSQRHHCNQVKHVVSPYLIQPTVDHILFTTAQNASSVSAKQHTPKFYTFNLESRILFMFVTVSFYFFYFMSICCTHRCLCCHEIFTNIL